MNRELKKDLFNIYDVIVFEDENGITQDCVCAIGEDKEVDEAVGVVDCNSHSISICENGSYKIWEKDGKDMPYYATNKKIIHLYTLKNDNRYYEIYPTNDYESYISLDKAESSEALKETLRDIEIDLEYDDNPFLRDRYYGLLKIKQALIKQQELPEPFKTGVDIGVIKPKRYLKWEDLEFKEEKQIMLVLLNGEKYILNYHRIINKTFCYNRCFAQLIKLDVIGANITIANSDFFNDLHLERVEE